MYCIVLCCIIYHQCSALCKSCIVFIVLCLLCFQLYIMCFCTVLYNATLYTASAGCCVSKLCAVDVSPVLRLYYCQQSVPSCEDYTKFFVVFAQCSASRVYREGAMITPLVILFCYFYYSYQFPLVGS